MNAEYKKAAEKLLCGITDKRLHEPTIWNDILSSVHSGKLRIWEINDEILRIKYFCKEKIDVYKRQLQDGYQENQGSGRKSSEKDQGEDY